MKLSLSAAAACGCMHGVIGVLITSWVGVRPICQQNFGNNMILKELRIMLEYYDKFWNNRINLAK